MKKQMKKTAISNKQALSIGLGITAAVAAAAGGFLLYGSKDAAKNRKAVQSWALKAKAEVLEGIEQAKEMSQEDYEKLVEAAVATYATAKSASKTELADFKKEMKGHWQGLVKTATPKKAAAKKAPAKKAVAKKAAPKKAAK